MAIKYLKKSPKTSSTDDSKTTKIVKGLLKDIEETIPIGNKDQMYNLLLNYYKNFFNNNLINDSIGQKARNKIILKYSIRKMIMNYNNIWKI